jgi:hypothetical protein
MVGDGSRKVIAFVFGRNGVTLVRSVDEYRCFYLAEIIV